MIDTSYLFKALADKQRIKILAAVADRGLTPDEIGRQIGLAPSLVNRHLYVLQEAGLVEKKGDGRTATYRFRQQPLIDALRSLAEQPPPQDFGDRDPFDGKVLSTFIEDGRLKSIPVQGKKREVILRFLAERFESNRIYEEKEVNAILREYHDDVASLRRYMVDGDLLERQIVRVVEAEALMQGSPEVEYRISYWKKA